MAKLFQDKVVLITGGASGIGYDAIIGNGEETHTQLELILSY
jgi:short-subunit dehydrogenase involved in D-alanine esterification of teichoic acids